MLQVGDQAARAAICSISSQQAGLPARNGFAVAGGSPGHEQQGHDPRCRVELCGMELRPRTVETHDEAAIQPIDQHPQYAKLAAMRRAILETCIDLDRPN
jgi:hypothetical protein